MHGAATTLWCALLGVGALAVGASWQPTTEQDYGAFYPPHDPTTLTGPGPRPRDADETLRAAAAKRGVYVGAAVNAGVLATQEPGYETTFASQYDLATAENSCKFMPTEETRGQFTFDHCRLVLNTTLAAKGAFRAHNLIWGNDNPPWLNGEHDAATLQATLREHIGNVTAGIGSHAYCWDVVNEAVANSGSSTFKNVSPWYPALPTYVEDAFRAAHETAPAGVKLFYNDYGAEGLNGKSDLIFAMVKGFQDKGVRVDGIGLQMHVSTGHYPSFADVAANIKRLGGLGLEVHITEMDVWCVPPCDADLQSHIYAGIATACLSQPNCKSIETWGFTDKHSWLNSKHGGNASALPFDTHYNKKKAYYGLLAALQNTSDPSV